MSALAFRETVTVIDVLDTGTCIDGALKFVTEFGLISVAASAFPDNRHIQLAALIYDHNESNDDNNCGYGEDYGDAKGNGHSHDYAYYFDYRPGLHSGYSNGVGNGFGYGYGYGNGHYLGGGSGQNVSY